MAFRFPFTIMSELNLDWILEQVRKFSELIVPMENLVSTSDDAYNTALQAKGIAENALDTAQQSTIGIIADRSITTQKIALEAVTSDELADDAVTTSKIVDSAVTTDKLDSLAVHEGNIDNGAVTNVKLAELAVATANIQDGAVTLEKISPDAVVNMAVPNSSITTPKLAGGAVTTDKIANGAVDHDKLSPGAVYGDRITDLAITTAKLADGSVTTSKIADLNVTTGKLADGAVTTAKILDGNITTAKLDDGSVTTAKLATSAVTTAKILDLNVTTAKIADGAITAGKIAPGVIPEIPEVGLQLDELWSNPNPSSAFSAATISIDMDGYIFAYITYAADYTYGEANSVAVAPLDYPNTIGITLRDPYFSPTYPNDLYMDRRGVTFTDNSIVFSDNYTYLVGGDGSAITSNSRKVPIKIYGVREA